ncbi:MAG: hypothetical protein HY749_06855 [Gammaproteobacteria bacterium]|nr:hypothetical protein [Gammaproteobacteria bacterium]MBI5614819.1 hypothetical protein [Gammaproteobacteria bacterium]
MAGLPTPVLGRDDDEFEIADRETLAAMSLALASQARRSIDLISRQLDPTIYDDEDFAGAVKNLALSSPQARVRILVLDPGALVTKGHRLLELAQRLSSFISIRRPAPEDREFNEAWLVVDGTGYIHRRFSDRHEAQANFNDKRHAQLLSNRLEDLWYRASPDPNFRRLHL